MSKTKRAKLVETKQVKAVADPMSSHKFETDHRLGNIKLHYLYVKWALKHLVALDCIQNELGNFANTNMSDVQVAMHRSRRELIQSNAAYAEAQEILHTLEPYFRRLLVAPEDPATVDELMASWLDKSEDV